LESNVQGSSAYYPAAAVERSAGKFKAGTHIYLNHMGLTEREERPEGDVNNLIGVLGSDAVFKEDGLYADIDIFSDKRAWLMERAEHIGLSIRAEGSVEEADGVPTLVEISKVHSVDVVTKAGAGGKFVSILESAREHNSEPISEHKKEETELEISKEFIEALESQAKLTNELLEAMKADRDAKVQEAADLAEAERVAKEEAGKPVAPSAAAIAEALVEAKLAPKARARVLKAVEGGADLAESIKEEQDIAAEILESAGAEGFGSFEDSKPLAESERADKLVASIFG
jgi:hypothetical protein